ncbi:alpha-amylase family protein [Saccharopolyspora gloriosae]|uniref:alpha-amylase n=1 Tax=Saccharopolyspora gloriosae TaxID=455344 RepID=UPI001FB65384|nr:alpha-amylase family protein [Saccharopolyspora gloriosae]
MRLPVLALAVAFAGVAVVPAAAAVTPATPAPAPAPAAAPATAPVSGPIVQMFQWPWESIAQECRSTLGPKGFGAVQVSPPQEHVQLSGEGHPWYQDYQPVSYQLETRRGDREQFASMVSACNDAGVEIYADAVVNHMAASDAVGSAGTTHSKYDYPGLYSDADFSDCRRDIADYDDKWEVRNCELVGLSDLKTGTDYVRSAEIGYLNDLISLGVSGFRVDGVKHMPPEDVGAIFGGLNTVPDTGAKPYMFQEVIADQTTSAGEYAGNGDVTEFAYHHKVSSAFKDGSLAQLANVPDEMTLPSDQAVVFIDNHDTQRSEPTLTYKDGVSYDLANAFMLAYPYGTPQLISGFAFDDPDAGPPADSDGRTSPANCADQAWVCEHQRPIIAGMAGFHQAVQGKELTNWWDDGSGRIAFGRADAGFVVINREDGEITDQEFQTSLPAGTYCDVMSGSLENGSCTGATAQVRDDGTVTTSVPGNSGIALHAGAKLS